MRRNLKKIFLTILSKRVDKVDMLKNYVNPFYLLKDERKKVKGG